jgi:hypothetical protein
MDFFSGSQPQLIGDNSLKTLENALNQPNSGSSIGLGGGISSFYKDCIEPNLFVIALLLIFCLFLYYKYITKDKKKKVVEGFEADEVDKLAKQFVQKRYAPVMNPYVPLTNQNSYVNYMPNHIPINIGDRRTTYFAENYSIDPALQTPPLLEPAKLENPETRIVYNRSVMNNLYENAQDPAYPHPYGWPDNENSSTAHAVQFTYDKNKENLQQYVDILYNENKKLENAF